VSWLDRLIDWLLRLIGARPQKAPPVTNLEIRI
jgi:hypothetical protein